MKKKYLPVKKNSCTFAPILKNILMMKHQSSRRQFLKTTAQCSALLMCGSHLLGSQTSNARRLPIEENNPAVALNQGRCRNCANCIDFCKNHIGVYGYDVAAGEEACIYCGQCTLFCPRIITEKLHYQEVAQVIKDPEKIVIFFTAPAIRVALGEMYGLAAGTNVEGKIVASLRAIAGVDYVLDTTFFADLTVMEEAAELLQRLDNKGEADTLPMFTSCCPSWVRFAKLFYPSLIPNISTVKSPVMMQGAIVKTYFAQQKSIDPKKIVTIAIAPCTSKKAEILLPGINAAGEYMRDVDFVITTRELAYLFNDAGIDFLQMPDNAQYNSLIGVGSGAGMIFGNTGGVMEATLRTAYRMATGNTPPADFLNFTAARGFDNVREANNVNIGKHKLNIAIVHGTIATRSFLEKMKNDAKKYDFIEIQACAGGCIGGGGQPVNRNMDENNLRQLRRNALFMHGDSDQIQLSCENSQIQLIYENFLGHPLSPKAKEILHTNH